MGLADRTFQIMQTLRRSTRPVTAAALTEELEVSQRNLAGLRPFDMRHEGDISSVSEADYLTLETTL
jgi:hypothetical protein